MTLRDRPVAHLTRHFYNGLFDLGFLSEAGTLSFTRLVIGVCAVFLSFGLLSARVFRTKYRLLDIQGSTALYDRVVQADHAFLIAVPMWIVAFLTVLVGHAVFPDELDFRVLVSLPIKRRLVFGAKMLALALFVGLFLVSMHVALTPLAALTLFSRWAEGVFALRWAAYLTASVLASMFAAFAVIAIHGLLVLMAPSGRVMALSAALRSVMLCVLMMSLPFVARFPGTAADFGRGASWLALAPPAWFVGVERWLLGDTRPHIVALAAMAAGMSLLVGAVAVGSYALLYRHFERVIVRPSEKPPLAAPARRSLARFSRPVRPVAMAVRSFAFKTLRRSVLHQGIVVVLAAIGAGLVVNSFIMSDLIAWMSSANAPRPGLIASAIWTPFAFMYIASRAVRMALLVPIEPKANWIFRMTERDDHRPLQIGAVVSTVYLLGVLFPVALLAPIQWMVLDAGAPVSIGLMLVYGWMYVELLMSDWGRLPFTCSYIPGKRFLPHAVVFGALQFLAFTTFTSGLVRFTLVGHPSAIALDILAAGAALFLYRRRVTWSRHTPLEFEDSLPNEVSQLRLSSD
jgi:hypothetical protein